jgi:hypothetical protein
MNIYAKWLTVWTYLQTFIKIFKIFPVVHIGKGEGVQFDIFGQSFIKIVDTLFEGLNIKPFFFFLTKTPYE